MSKCKSYRSIVADVAFPSGDFASLPPELRGPAQNKYGGYRSGRLRPLKGSKLGPANPGRRVTDPGELSAIIDDLRRKGFIT